MKAKDQLKIEVMFKVTKGELKIKEAALLLNKSERSLARYLKDFKERGIKFIHHKNTNQKPKNKIPEEIKKHVQALVKETYFDFNVSHLKEKLVSDHNISINYETLRKWCHDIGYIKKARKRRSNPRYHRVRMSQEGLLVQLDGSHHRWFGDRKLCLMALIDDATSEVYARFYEGETTWACMDFLTKHIEKKGVPVSFYTDRAGLFGGIKRNHFSQVERALGEVGSQIIYAHSPEAKGRVERLFGTLQDRLVPEMRLRGIATISEANQFLEQVYLPHMHNSRFRVLAHNPITAYKALATGFNLEDAFCIKEFRGVGRDHTISINGMRYMIADDLRYSLNKQKVVVKFDKWGAFKVYFANKELKLVIIQKCQKRIA